MSLPESPVHPSSSDEFASLIESALASGSSESSPEEANDETGAERSTKRRKLDNHGSIVENQRSTSQVCAEEISEETSQENEPASEELMEENSQGNEQVSQEPMEETSEKSQENEPASKELMEENSQGNEQASQELMEENSEEKSQENEPASKELMEVNSQGNEQASQELMEENSEASPKKDICAHPGSFGDMCMLCGKRLDNDSSVNISYIHKGLKLKIDEIDRLRNMDIKTSSRNKKLYLVLDLDHTVLNSTKLSRMTKEEEYLLTKTDSLQDVSKGSLFRVDSVRMMTKLRPFVRTFLKEANEMYEMYIYTLGERAYAQEMASLLDPMNEYFADKVISRDDGTQKRQKGLDVVIGHESKIVILDDREDAWTKHKENLILMERYHFFRSSCQQFGYNCKSLSELRSDEIEQQGALAAILEVLKRVHSMFFEEMEDNLNGRDVRQLLKTLKKEVLKGCKIVFTGVYPSNFKAQKHHLWKMAEQLGATCSTEVDPSVTHVVSTNARTEKSRWAVKEKKFLVQPRWLDSANYMWAKQAEDKFPVQQMKTQ